MHWMGLEGGRGNNAETDDYRFMLGIADAFGNVRFGGLIQKRERGGGGVGV